MAKDCPNTESNLRDCNCSYDPCPRKGTCCECIRYHREMGELPACYFSTEDERSYDRSVARFIRSQGR